MNNQMQIGTGTASPRRYFSKTIDELGATNLFLLLVLAVITLYPLIFVGFTTNDDATLAMNWGSGSIWETAKIGSKMQGRFGGLWGYFLAQVPYIFDNRIWYLAMKFGALFLLLCALYYAVYQSFRSSWIALASLAFFLMFIQNGWDHNALTSYPFVFNFYAILFLVSLGLFSIAIDRRNLVLAVLSGGLYFFSLGVELFVLFFPFYIAVLLSRGTPGKSVVRQIVSGRKYILAIALPLMTYLAIYLAWRVIHPSSYDGNSLNGLSLLASGEVITAYSLNAFPVASLNFMLSTDEQMLLTSSAGMREILLKLNAMHFIKSAAAGFLFVRLMTTQHFIVPQERTLIIGAALTCVGVFLPNLLLGFVRRHQDWVASGSDSYLYTYYSFISAVIFSALVVAYMNVKSRLWHPRLRLLLICVGTITVMVLSFAVEVRNQYIAFDQKLSHRKWQLMDEVIKSPAFMKIPNDSTVVAPTLSAYYRGIAQTTADYWSKYIRQKTGKTLQFVNDKCKNEIPCYSLIFRQKSYSDNQFIVLAKIKNTGPLVSPELRIYSIPNQFDNVLIGSFLPSEVSPKLELNGEPVGNVGTESFSSVLPFISSDASVQTARVTGNVDFFLDQVTISQYGIAPRLKPFSVELGNGFYGLETSPGQPTWAWSKGMSTLHVINHDRKATLVSVKFEVTSLEKLELRISGVSTQSLPVVPGVYRPVEIEFMAQPGVTRIALLSDRPPIQPSSGDSRLLSFSVRSPYIKNR